MACPNDKPWLRLGVVIGKRKVALAVKRNRLRRLVREQFRLEQAKLSGLDWVVLVQAAANQGPSRDVLRCDLAALCSRVLKQCQRASSSS